MRKNFNQVTLRYNEQNKIPLPGTGLLTGFLLQVCAYAANQESHLCSSSEEQRWLYLLNKIFISYLQQQLLFLPGKQLQQ